MSCRPQDELHVATLVPYRFTDVLDHPVREHRAVRSQFDYLRRTTPATPAEESSLTHGSCGTRGHDLGTARQFDQFRTGFVDHGAAVPLATGLGPPDA